MSEEKELGKISKVRFGLGGRDGMMVGLSVTLGMGGSCVDDFEGTWVERPKNAEWTTEDHKTGLASLSTVVAKLLKDAKKLEVSQLKDTPVEVTLSGNLLKSWRILTEVI